MVPTTPNENSQNDSTEKINEEISQINITDEEVHPNDIVGKIVHDHLIKGGSNKNAHVFSSFEDLTNTFEKLILEVKNNSKNPEPFGLVHGGRKISNLRTKGLFDCFNRKNSGLGVNLKRMEDGKIRVTINGSNLHFDDETFMPFKAFLKDVCHIVEYSKLQYNDQNKNFLAYHMESYNDVSNSEHKENFVDLLGKGLKLFQENVYKAYGKDNVDMLVSKFRQMASGALPKFDHNRVLAKVETGTTPSTGLGAHFAYSIKYVFGLTLLLIYIYTCVYIYLIEVFKDSLVYSKFISVRKK